LAIWSALTAPEILALRDLEKAAAGDAMALLALSVFASGSYNCVSSTLLYTVLARAFGFEVRGIILPSHTFVQLTLPDDKIVEVETTTPDGYDWAHDEAFYAQRAGSWMRVRGLPASTYRDYLARAIVSPLEMIAYNMSNQHTASGLMAQEDRGRLAEVRAHIDPTSREAQINRLDFHNTEYLLLYKRGEWVALERMFRKISPLWSPLRKQWEKDADLINRLAWLPYEYATTLQACIDKVRESEKCRTRIRELP